jgi:hypothetical protein
MDIVKAAECKIYFVASSFVLFRYAKSFSYTFFDVIR